MTAPDPNRIDVSLALLPGESQTVINDLIEQLTAVSGQIAALMSGNEYAPVQGVMTRQSATASQDRPVDVNILSVSPTASFAMPNEGRAKAKLGAAEAAAVAAGGIPLGGDTTQEVDNASQSTIPAPGGGPLPDEEVQEVVEEEDLRNRRQKLYDRLIERDDPEGDRTLGNINFGGTAQKSRVFADEVRDYAMTYGVFQGAHRGTQGEVDQLKRSFTPDNLETVGTTLGGDPAPAIDLGPLGNNVLPGMKYIQGIAGLLGIGNSNSAAAIGARVESQAAADAWELPYLNQQEARTLTHGAIGRGWTEDEADRDRQDFSELRNDRSPGLGPLRNLDARTYSDMREEVRRDGATSMNELNKALKEMPSAAKAARMEFNEFVADSIKLADTMKARGATYGQGLRAGPEFAAQTGMAPSVMGAAMQNPMVQGALVGQGLMPQIQGLATAQEVTNATQTSVRSMYDTFLAGMTPDVKTTAHGTVTVRTAEEKAEAFTADAMGLPRGNIQKWLGREETGAGTARTTALDDIMGYEKQTADIAKNTTGAKRLRLSRGMRTGRGAPEEAITRPEVMESLRAAGVSEKELTRIGRTGSATAFQAAARSAIGMKTAADTQNAPGDSKTINEVIVEVQATGVLKDLLKTKVTKNETHKRAAKERDRGRGNYNHSNPDGEPPDKGWSIFDAGSYLGG